MVMESLEHAGDRLALALERAKKTQAQLADACGVSVQAVSKWIKKGQIARERLPLICEFLGVSMEWLVGSSIADESPGEGTRGLPPGKYVFVKRHKVKVPHGHEDESERFEEVDDEVAFRAAFFRRKGWEPSHLSVFYAKGESMAPRIRPGDVLLLDTREEKRIEDGAAYAIRYGETEEKVKRLRLRFDGALIIYSDNPDPKYREEVVAPEDFGHIHIIGKVVWLGGGV